MKKNTVLRKAFEEAAEREINSLPREEQIIRPFTEEFENKMQNLFDSFDKKEEKTVPVKKRKIKWAALIAAVLMTAMFTVTASAFVKGESIWSLFDFTPDPEKYENIDVEFEESYLTGSGETEIREIIYDGKKINFQYSIDTGETWEWPDRGIMVYIDGVRQTFNAETEEQEYNNIDMLHINNEKGSVRSIEFSLEPNIGKKGDEMFLSVVAIFDPYVTYYPQCKTEHKELFVGHWDDDNDRICDKCSINIDEIPSGPSSYTMHTENIVRLVMKKDAPEQINISKDFSGLKADKLNKRIYRGYESENSSGEKTNDYDTMKGLRASVYKDIKDSYFTEWGAAVHATKIKTKAKENDEFTVNLHGGTGKYRVGVYINNEIQNVFDGAAYADVDVVHGEQTELNFNLDTTKLPKGDNYCYVLFQKLDGEMDIFRWIDSDEVYTIEVK